MLPRIGRPRAHDPAIRARIVRHDLAGDGGDPRAWSLPAQDVDLAVLAGDGSGVVPLVREPRSPGPGICPRVVGIEGPTGHRIHQVGQIGPNWSCRRGAGSPHAPSMRGWIEYIDL